MATVNDPNGRSGFSPGLVGDALSSYPTSVGDREKLSVVSKPGVP